MLKKLIKQLTPSPSQIRNNRFLKRFGKHLNAEYLWQINRKGVIRAATLGVLIAFLPIPGHMILAALGALFLRSNLAVAIASVWISNPITALPMYTFGYLLGAQSLGVSIQEIEFQSWKVILDIWEPLFLGCTLLGILSACLTNIALRAIWAYSVNRRWQKRSRALQEESVL